MVNGPFPLYSNVTGPVALVDAGRGWALPQQAIACALHLGRDRGPAQDLDLDQDRPGRQREPVQRTLRPGGAQPPGERRARPQAEAVEALDELAQAEPSGDGPDPGEHAPRPVL